MRFTRLIPRFNIIKRFCQHNNLSEQFSKNVNFIKDTNIASINSKLNDIDTKLNDIEVNVKNMDAIVFSFFCIWNVVYFPIILYLI